MNYDIAPRELKANGKTYYLTVTEYNDETFKGWWSYMYKEKGKNKNSDTLPPEATDGKDIYYLCSMSSTKQKAEEEILEKINNMQKILSEEDVKKQRALAKKRLKNFFRKD